MDASIRRATRADLPELVDLLLRDAQQRSALDPALWRVADDARARIEVAAAAVLDGSNARSRERWHVAEVAGRIVGATHAMVVQPPPIYAVPEPPGLFLDDCFTTADAPPGTAEALLVATEAALRAAGASGLIASCPMAGPWRGVYARHGYEPVTLYMAKSGFDARAVPAGVRRARAEDVTGIVEASAAHRQTLSELNPRFWPTHPDANVRFEGWMRYSLTLADRDMFVAADGEVRGYIIAQPIAALLLPAAHSIETVGVIDDFYDADFADVSVASRDGATARKLLSAAEGAFARRGFAAALAVCPATWQSKIAALERSGYRGAKLWKLKR
jgi:hypothetical protein